MITYIIEQKGATQVEVTIDEDGQEKYPLLDPRGDNGGFGVGYGGTGVRNLAFAMLAHWLGETNLERWELDKFKFLSWKLSHDFMAVLPAILDPKRPIHYVYEGELRGYMRFHHPNIDVEEYKEKRDQFRKDIRDYEILEDKLEAGEYANDPVMQQIKQAEWQALWNRMLSFENYVNNIDIKTEA